jgi:CheY-like chemotaxis protein
MELESLGHSVQVVYDGEQALRLAETFRPQLVFLDLGMPKLNGYETCRLIRQAQWGTDMTVVAQTGWGREGDRERTRDAGFDHHLVKPIDQAALATLLMAVRDRLNPELN